MIKKLKSAIFCFVAKEKQNYLVESIGSTLYVYDPSASSKGNINIGNIKSTQIPLTDLIHIDARVEISLF